MKAAVRWIKDALMSKDIADHLQYYLVREGMVYATDGRMTAAHPFEYDGPSFLVRGSDFERVLLAAPDVCTLTLTEGTVIVKAKKFKAQFRTLDETVWPYDAGHSGDWEPFPMALVGVMKTLRPFVSDNAAQVWATCLGLFPGYAYATNNIVIARTAFVNDRTLPIPSWTIDFVLARAEGIVKWAITEQCMWVGWEHGAWLRSVTPHGAFPPRVHELLSHDEAITYSHQIDPEWREAFGNVVGVTSAEQILFTADHIRGGTGDECIVEEEMSTPVSATEGHACYHPPTLRHALAAATEWSPDVWPQPTPFRGPAIEGIIAGRRPA